MADKKSKNPQEQGTAGGVNLTNCEFKAVEWDGKAVEAVATIASALHQNAVAIAENAAASAKLMGVFLSQNLKLDGLLSIKTTDSIEIESAAGDA